jgi:hypothetical protein
VYDNGGVCVLEFDVEISATAAGTFHSDLQLYLDYNPLGFGNNVVTNGNITYYKLDMLDDLVFGSPMYAIYGHTDNTPTTYAILSEAQFGIPNPMFMNEVPSGSYAGYIKFVMNIQDQNELAGIYFRNDLMDGGNYYRDITNPSPAAPYKYGIPPGYAGIYNNDLLTQPLSCGVVPVNYVWNGVTSNDWDVATNWTPNGIPTIMDNADIPAGTPNDPWIFGMGEVCILNVAAGATLTIDYTGSLTTNGPFTCDGDFTIISEGLNGYAGSYIDMGGLAGNGMFYFTRMVLCTGTVALSTDPL